MRGMRAQQGRSPPRPARLPAACQPGVPPMRARGPSCTRGAAAARSPLRAKKSHCLMAAQLPASSHAVPFVSPPKSNARSGSEKPRGLAAGRAEGGGMGWVAWVGDCRARAAAGGAAPARGLAGARPSLTRGRRQADGRWPNVALVHVAHRGGRLQRGLGVAPLVGVGAPRNQAHRVGCGTGGKGRRARAEGEGEGSRAAPGGGQGRLRGTLHGTPARACRRRHMHAARDARVRARPPPLYSKTSTYDRSRMQYLGAQPAIGCGQARGAGCAA